MSHFNEAANTWDSPEKVKRVESLGEKIKVNPRFLARENMDIMDFGCGTGLLGFQFIDNAKSIVGIDTSQGMLDVFDEKTINQNNFESLNVNLEDTPINRKFDLIVSSMTFHHLKDPGHMISKFSEMLNENGQIALIDLETEDGSFHGDNQKMGVNHFGFSKEEVMTWAAAADVSADYSTVEEINKNDKTYKLFLSILA
jgi:predicted TPR repeat methyltransferase